MKKLSLIFLLCLTICGCRINTSEFTDKQNFDSFHYMNARLVVKDYDIKGTIHGEYQNIAFYLDYFRVNKCVIVGN